MPHKGKLAICLLAIAAGTLDIQANAQTYPDHTINLVVGVTPGGLVDIVTRHAADQLQKKLGATIVVTTRTGAGGVVAAQSVVQSPSDGYTVLALTSGTFTAAELQTPQPYTINDLIPVALIAEGGGVVIAVRKGLPISNLQELIAYAKANPNKLNYGSSGSAGPVHLAILQFLDLANIQMTHIAYRGAVPATQALLQGEVDLTLVDPNGFAQQIKDGTIIPVARAGEPPAKGSENLPRLSDAVPGYDSKLWVGLAVPARTPPAIVEKLNKTMSSIASEGLITQPLATVGMMAKPMDQQAFQQYVVEDAQRWGNLIRKYKITAQ